MPLDTDTIASNYVILSDDLSYAKTFYRAVMW